MQIPVPEKDHSEAKTRWTSVGCGREERKVQMRKSVDLVLTESRV